MSSSKRAAKVSTEPQGNDYRIARLIAVAEGAAVMAIELTGAKLLTPFYGNSLVVWTAVLSITLAALAAGYFLGGRYSGKRNITRYTIAGILSLVAILAMLLPVVTPKIILFTSGQSIVTGALMSAVLVIFPPLLLLGMIPPCLVRMLSRDASHTGKRTGEVFALSSIGALVSSLLVGFVILPSWGVIACCAFITVVAGAPALMFFVRGTQWLKAAVPALAILIALGMSVKREKKTASRDRLTEIYHSDGLLGQLTIEDDKQLGWRKLYINNVSQTLMHIPTGRSQWKYVHRLAAYSSMKPAGSSVLVAGLGGGNLVNEMVRLGFNVDVIDLDKRMEEIARRHFFMQSSNVNVFIDDARHFIRTSEKKYDIVIIDLSAGENQPSNLYTVEGFSDIASILNENGIFFLHYPHLQSLNDPRPLEAIGRTLVEAGFHTRLINTSSANAETNEFIFVSTLREMDLSKQSFARRDTFAYPYNFPFKQDVYMDVVDFSKGEVMTDNRPLMDYLHRENVSAIRRGVIKDRAEKLRRSGKDIYK